MSASPALSTELVEFLESGVSILVGTRNAGLRPACLRAVGAKVDGGRRIVTLYMPQATCEPTLSNLRDNGRLAVTFSRAVDHRSIQLKGACLAIRPSGEADRAAQARYLDVFCEQLGIIGLPSALVRRVAWWPSQAVEVSVLEMYEQTPGPLAGARLDA